MRGTVLERPRPRLPYRQSPAMQKALDEIRWKIPAAMIKARKDAARGVLRGEPCAYAMDLPLRIAQRYARRKAFLAAKQKAQLIEIPPDVAMGGAKAIDAYLRAARKETV